jgi:hypothetical protein
MKWAHSILTLLATALVLFAPQIQHLVASHPTVSAFVVGLYTVLGHMLPSPVKS